MGAQEARRPETWNSQLPVKGLTDTARGQNFPSNQSVIASSVSSPRSQRDKSTFAAFSNEIWFFDGSIGDRVTRAVIPDLCTAVRDTLSHVQRDLQSSIFSPIMQLVAPDSIGLNFRIHEDKNLSNRPNYSHRWQLAHDVLYKEIIKFRDREYSLGS